MAKKTAGSPSLKAENGKAIWLLVSADIVAIVLLLTGFTFSQASLSELAQSAFVRGLLFAAVGPLVAVFLNDLLPSNAKASIVFWRIKDALPGHRAFSEHAEADPRIDIAALKKRVGEFPRNPRDQNSSWYRLFQKYQSNVTIIDSHKRFLLFRDSSSLTLLILVIAWLASVLAKAPGGLQATVAGGLAVQFLWLAVSARNTGIRLVQNVLALEASDDGGKRM
ncbi:MAG: hypothetical protein K2Y42_20875 [Hyphomicrobium sp.]|jgi:hypothetical protein|uniref:hypothetical protein n=1 Tax=Hyphomicrobium sp. TaxID=82 RepID=UPI0025BB1CEB|nr:hypothetical protein [Hyphomicrobium sp.]MBX9865204.1 hypothetical protein [Hyphomicrobium sp.]